MQSKRSTHALVTVVLLGLGSAWNVGNIGPVAGELSTDFAVSLAVVGLLSGTLYLGAVVVGTIITAPLAERIGLNRGLRLGCIVAVAGNLIFALSPWFWGLGVGRVLVGLNLALISVLTPVWARQIGGVRLVGLFGASIQAGIAGALGVGAVLADIGVDWRVGFLVSAGLGMAPLLLLRASGPSGEPQPHGIGFLRAAIHSPRVYRLATLFVALYGVPITLGAWLVLYLTKDDDMRLGLAGALGFLLFGVSAIGRVLGARLSQRGVPHAVVGGMLGLAVVALAALAIDRSFGVALPAVVALGFGFGIPYAMMLVSAQRLFPAEPAEPVALGTMIGTAVPIIVIPLVGSALSAGTGEVALLALAAFLLVATILNLRPTGGPITKGADPQADAAPG